MPANTTDLEKRLWDAADDLRANSKLKSSEYSGPVLGLIFLRYADHKFAQAQAKMASQGSGRRTIGRADYHAQGVLYIPEIARYSKLLELPEGSDIGKAINEAMRAIEADNEDLKGVLPRTYNRFDKELLVSLLKNFASIQMDIEGDAFGKIYEYFLGKFAMSEGQKGGEFFTPTSIVKLIVEIIEPYHGRILDPACGSGGMFVQSAAFVERHKKNPTREISICGQERTEETIRLCRMNLAVHGLSGDIKDGNTYYADRHDSHGRFDFVMANPPFNVDKVDKERIKDDPRYPFGLPRTDNANYLWMQIFYSALNPTGRAGFVMANSAGDARSSELDVRRKLIEVSAVDVIVSVGPNFFYTVTLPCTLWFLDRGKKKAKHKDKVLFIDARNIFRQLDRTHRDWTPEQIEFLANIVRLYRCEAIESVAGSQALMKVTFPKGKYVDVQGLCKVATLADIEEQAWSLNPGRYVGVATDQDNLEFTSNLEKLECEFEELTRNANRLEKNATSAIKKLLSLPPRKSGFKEVPLAELCTLITDGAHSSPKSVANGDGLPMASVKDMTPWGIDLDGARRISRDDFAALERQGCRPRIGDVLIAKDGATALDTVCEVKHDLEAVLLSSIAILRPDPKKVPAAYLRHFLESPSTKAYLKGGFITGAAIPRVILADFKRCVTRIPDDPSVVARYAEVLSMIDDLIENSMQRTKLLRKILSTVFRHSQTQ